MMEHSLVAVWRPLATTPLLWLAVTIIAYVLGQSAQRVCKSSPLANPVLIAIAITGALLEATGTSYETYFGGAQFINFLLGPATVALAVPLSLNLAHLRRSFHGVALALLAGSVTSTLSGVAVVWLLGGDRSITFSMAPKGITTPIALALAQEVGGVPALTAALAIAGGIVAAALGQTVFRWLDVDDWRAHGLAAGVAGSGIAAAQIAPLNAAAAAFAALGLGLNALLTAVLVPLIAMLWPVG
jgi:putative effector of murein hydrolase